MAERIAKKYWKELRRKKNVRGYDHSLQYRRKDHTGETVDELCFVVYVEKKEPEVALRSYDLLPKSLDGIPVDVREVGKHEALKVDKTKSFRPLVAGISIGHKDITAGTLGWFFYDKYGHEYLGSNAHVFTPDPSLKPSEISRKEILQPGLYDKGTEVVGIYHWHKRIRPMGECKLAKGVVDFLNGLSKLLGRESRFELVEKPNLIDFAVAKSTVKAELKLVDVDGLPEPFVGLGFAGSDKTSLVCKVQHIIAEDYMPSHVEICRSLKTGDVLEKTGRTSCHTKAKVLSTSTTMIVSYGTFEAEFSDVILTEKLLSPGDSGSAVWKGE